jgi:uncharacterized protein
VRLSRFVVTYRNARPGEHVLYDVLKDHYVGVDDATLAVLERWAHGPPQGEEEQEVQQVLREQALLVEDGAEDDARLRTFLEAAAEGIPGTMYVTLMPTLACNLACTYCFQKEHPAFTKMKQPMEAATMEWVLRKVDAAASRRLQVHYFGGEPLTRKDFLLRTAQVFSSAMAARGAVFEWEMTTNGVGLTPDFVRSMLVHGPGNIKVTLDGDKETHDAARVYRSGKGSFEEVFSCLVAVARECPEVKLRLGGNFLPEQAASYERLLDRLQAEGLTGRFEQIRFKPVVETTRTENGTCTSCAAGRESAQTLVQLNQSVDRRGLAQRSAACGTPSGPCELHWKNSYVIDPEGRVYKCPAVAGRPEMAAGRVDHSLERRAPLLELRPWEKCGPCPYLPVCVGGCLGAKYLQTGRRDEVLCRKEDFEAAFRTEVLGRYLAEFADEAHCETA